jgi:hypothetical protein
MTLPRKKTTLNQNKNSFILHPIQIILAIVLLLTGISYALAAEESKGFSDFINNALGNTEEKIETLVDDQDNQSIEETPAAPEDTPPPTVSKESIPGDYRRFGAFNIIDKSIGKVEKIWVGLDQPHAYHHITMRMLACWAPSELKGKPDHKALVEIYETINRSQKRIFYGWMFSQSPSLSALEHDRYDVTIANCSDSK